MGRTTNLSPNPGEKAPFGQQGEQLLEFNEIIQQG
jgi:hypothetical protein